MIKNRKIEGVGVSKFSTKKEIKWLKQWRVAAGNRDKGLRTWCCTLLSAHHSAWREANK